MFLRDPLRVLQCPLCFGRETIRLHTPSIHRVQPSAVQGLYRFYETSDANCFFLVIPGPGGRPQRATFKAETKLVSTAAKTEFFADAASLRVYVVAKQHILIPNVELAARNDRVRPTILVAAIRLIEAPRFLVGVRRCFNQDDCSFATFLA